jgi:hypothetical protein
VDHCLSFAACDRPEFREVLAVLEAEYRALRARQPPRTREHTQQQQPLSQNQQVHAGETHIPSQPPALAIAVMCCRCFVDILPMLPVTVLRTACVAVDTAPVSVVLCILQLLC